MSLTKAPARPATRTAVRPTRGSNETDRDRTRAEEAQLLREFAATGDPALKRELGERLMPLARSMAMRYRSGHEPLDDLIQVASLGLMKAIEGFDPDRGRPFAAYAAPTILGELRRHFRDHVWTVRLPRGLQERVADVREATEFLGDRLGASPTVGQLAEHLKLSEEEVLEALEGGDARQTVSLDAPRAADESEVAPMIESIGTLDQGYANVETQLAAEAANLDEREHEVLALRFGDDLTQAEIGKRLGVSQMQISRIMRGALRKLLDAARDDGVEAARNSHPTTPVAA